MEENNRVLGVGIGVLIIVILWSIVFLYCCIASHLSGRSLVAGFFIITIATTVTAILCYLPRSLDTHVDDVVIPVVDKYIIYRIVLVIIMALTLLAGLICTFSNHWSQPIQSHPLQKTQ